MKKKTVEKLVSKIHQLLRKSEMLDYFSNYTEIDIMQKFSIN